MTFKIEDAARTKEGGNNDMKVKTSVAKKRNAEQRLFKNQFTNELKSACLLEEEGARNPRLDGETKSCVVVSQRTMFESISGCITISISNAFRPNRYNKSIIIETPTMMITSSNGAIIRSNTVNLNSS